MLRVWRFVWNIGDDHLKGAFWSVRFLSWIGLAEDESDVGKTRVGSHGGSR